MKYKGFPSLDDENVVCYVCITGPEAVTALTVTTSSTDATRLDVTWEYSPTHQQCDLFIVEYMLINRDQCPNLPQGTRTLFSSMDITKSITLTGLYPYSTYSVFVRAMNDAGTGPEISADGTTSSAGMQRKSLLRHPRPLKGLLAIRKIIKLL